MYKRGLIKTIIIIVIALIVLGYFGFNIEDILKSQNVQANLNAFWNFILLGKEGYKGSVLEKHLHMALTKRDFERWVFLFTETILASYAGETADMAIQRAQTMAWTFATKFPEQ